MTDSPLLPPRLTPLAVAAAATLLLAAYALPIGGSGRYAAYLAVFSIWMAWFVRAVAGLLRDPDD